MKYSKLICNSSHEVLKVFRAVSSSKIDVHDPYA